MRNCGDVLQQSLAVASWQLRLLGGFEVRTGSRTVLLTAPHQRLVAAIALRRLTRERAAQLVWPDVDDIRAHPRLRTALWRLHTACPHLIAVTGKELRLGSDVSVDVVELSVGDRTHLFDDGWSGGASQIGWELLPGWEDDWVVVERERCRQLVLHGLEQHARMCLRRGDHGAALDSALLVLRESPLRDSAYRVVIDTHLAEGNASEAVRAYQEYRERLATELGVEPSAEVRAALVGHGMHLDIDGPRRVSSGVTALRTTRMAAPATTSHRPSGPVRIG